MADFEIECKKALKLAEQIDGCSRDVKKQEGRVAEVLMQMSSGEDNYRGMVQALSGITDSLHRQQEQLRQYGSVLGNIVKEYETAEAQLTAQGGQR